MNLTTNINHFGESHSANSHFKEMHGTFWLEDEVWHIEPFFVPLEQERTPKPLMPTTV